MDHKHISTHELALLCYKFVEDEEELYKYLEQINVNVDYVFKNCLEATKVISEADQNVENVKLEIESVLDYLSDEINTGHWKDIPFVTRRAFSVTCFIKAMIFLKTSSATNILPEVLKTLDLGLLLGAPLLKNASLLSLCASLISKKNYHWKTNMGIQPLRTELQRTNAGNRKRKINLNEDNVYDKLLATEIDQVYCPSLEKFNDQYFKPQMPIKITGYMSHWPAMHKWLNIDYFLQIAGDRTVPVELGSRYTDENWSQKLVTLREFIKSQFMSDAEDIGYLAQHNLFEQIAELREDICIPDYCSLSQECDDIDDGNPPDINAWFGPKGTLTPLHYDPKNNILAQVFGTKQILLFSHQDSEYLYPYDDRLLSNTSKVDPVNPNIEEFPLFKKTKMCKCLLGPGEMLFIPAKWWHYVVALDKSFSVSFWWD